MKYKLLPVLLVSTVVINYFSANKDPHPLSDWSYNILSAITERINNFIIPKKIDLSSDSSVKKVAKDVTVKIWSEDQFIGSGTIVSYNSDRYEIITNSHVLRSSEHSSFRIETSDGKFYDAQVIAYNSQQNICWDLALMSFSAPQELYQTTTFAEGNSYQLGDSVFVAGFLPNAHKQELEQTQKKHEQINDYQFTLTTGEIYSILDQSLVSGYQIGFTNMLKKGMSGGPLLNNKGELIGINGRHAYPLWESVDFYEDGTQISDDVQDVIDSHSWAISINTVIQFYQEVHGNFTKSSDTFPVKESAIEENQLDLCR